MSLIYAYAGDIVKYEDTDDGLMVYGKATGPDLDLDEQICDPGWLRKAMPEWMEYGNVREMHGPVLAGVGKELSAQGDDWHLKSKCIDPTAATKIREGGYKGYSIGIRNARVVKDAQAPNGRIVGGTIAEISYVDRPCNPTAKMAICKAAAGGQLVPVDAGGKMLDTPAPAASAGVDLGQDVGPDGQIVKAYGAATPPAAPVVKDVNTANPGGGKPKGKKGKQKTNRYGPLPTQAATGDGGDPDVVNPSANGPLAAVSPFGGTVKNVDVELTKRDYTQDQRDAMAADGRAMPDGSFPIDTADDLDNAIGLAGNASNPTKARKHIKRRARALGMQDRIPDTWSTKLVKGVGAAGITPDMIKLAVTEATKALQDKLNAVEAQLAKVAATPIPGGPVLITGATTRAAQDPATTKAAQYRAMANASTDPAVAAAYRDLAKREERALP